MTLTLLLDLDGTLLVNEMGAFVAGYMRVLARHMAPYAEPSHLVNTLLSATQKMAENNRPDRTLREAFNEVFYPSLGIKEEEVRETIDAFYREVFPTLKELTRFRPEALTLVEEALRRGYRVGIATNPLFPRAAILHRVNWAGLEPGILHAIDLIPSYENFHFAKPNPAFYAEFLGQMGWPEGPVLMVGNDPEADILAARRMGLPTFFTPEDDYSYPDGNQALSPGGILSEVIPWIDKVGEQALMPAFSSPEALLAILRSTPAALNSLTYGLPLTAWTECTQPGEWCMAEITCHLRDVDAEVNIPRMEKIMEENNPFLAGMNTDPWVNERQYIAQDCTQALNDFTTNRMKLLSLLDRIHPEDWRRPARHAIFGPTQLEEMVSIIAGHDRLHIQQAIQTLPK